MDYMFRLLTAREIECRIQSVKPNGVTLLLYKDARCDMSILDETVGPMNWKREHSRDNANCTISIWDKEKSQWISKEDTGTESNTEKEKGLASDSFKRSGTNWGIGRELYTAPFIWIPNGSCTIKDGKCNDRFKVTEIGYNQFREINSLTITNEKTGEVVYKMGQRVKKAEPKKLEENKEKPTENYPFICEICGKPIQDHISKTGVRTPAKDLYEKTFSMIGKHTCGKCLLDWNRAQNAQ